MITEMISPNVYQTEQDISYLPQTSQAGELVIIGTTEMGEAFIPTDITSVTEFNTKYGYSNKYNYVPQTVYNFLKYGNITTVVRLMSENGYTHDSTIAIAFEVVEDATQSIIALLHRAEGSTKIIGDDAQINITITHISGHEYTANIEVTDGAYASLTESYTFSLVSTASNYISKVFSTSPQTSKLVYLYNIFDEKISELITYITSEGYTYTLEDTSFDLDFDSVPYTRASTPWIISQFTDSNDSYNKLFKFNTFSQGNNMNKKVKISLENIKYASEVPNSDYGTFTVLVREFDDTDVRPVVLERFNNVTLNPTDTNYIARVIGDSYKTIVGNKIIKHGNYANLSNYIYVEINADVNNGTTSPELVPFGFEKLQVPVIDSTIENSFPITKLITLQDISGVYNTKVYHGYNFDSADNIQYLMQIATSNGTSLVNNINTLFNLDNCIIHNDASQDAGANVGDSSLLSARKFSIPFQNGFDGDDPAKYKAIDGEITSSNVFGFDCGDANATGTALYKKAFLILSNVDVYDFNILTTPGINYRLHPAVITSGINLCELRGDVIYLTDISAKDDSVATATNATSTLDTNFASTYFPWGKLFDSDTNSYRWMPTSVFVPQAIAFNDKIGYQWNAPAGLNRGVLDNVLDVAIELDINERDELYEANINPIATFKEGITVWGQKTLQQKSSALDRVNVRRLLINLKKYTNSKVKYSVFEGNTQVTRNKIINILSPYLDRVQQKGGLYAYKIIMDETNNTADVIDRNMLKGKIAIKPTKTAEIIDITWSIVGSDFDLETI